MAGNNGLQALIKSSAPENMWTHYIIHHESLAYTGIMPRTERSDGYSDQNCKLNKDSSIEKQTFCRIIRGNASTVSVTLVLL
jgi:hypothetical protein